MLARLCFEGAAWDAGKRAASRDDDDDGDTKFYANDSTLAYIHKLPKALRLMSSATSTTRTSLRSFPEPAPCRVPGTRALPRAYDWWVNFISATDTTGTHCSASMKRGLSRQRRRKGWLCGKEDEGKASREVIAIEEVETGLAPQAA